MDMYWRVGNLYTDNVPVPCISIISLILLIICSIYCTPISVQDECIPQAILGMDVICQAKSGMGKTAVFVIATLQQLEPVDGQVSVLVMCHARWASCDIYRSNFIEHVWNFAPCMSVEV